MRFKESYEEKNYNRFKKITNFELWKKSVSIIDNIVNQAKTNKHFNTLIIDYYRKLNLEYKNKVKEEKYYESKIKSLLFYGYEKEYFSISYFKSKKVYTMRKQIFLSYPLLAIHNMIVIYLYELVNEFYLNHIQSNIRINSFYGGKFSTSNTKFEYDDKSLYYYESYIEYRKKLFEKLERKTGINYDIVIKIDIQNYYNNISVSRYLDKIDESLQTSRKKERYFDDYTKRNIIDFFSYVMEEKNGIPAIEYSALNNFLGYFYLCFADIKIHDTFITKYKDIIKDFDIIRYIDDTYIFIKFKDEDLKENEKLDIIIEILSFLREMYFLEFGLTMNDKTKCFDLSNHEHIKELKNVFKITSQVTFNYSDKNENVKEKYRKIKCTLKKVVEKGKSIDDFFYKSQNLNVSVLNDIYAKNVNKFLEKPENKQEIYQILKEMTRIEIKLNSKAILVLMFKYGEELIENIKLELLQTKNLTLEDIEIILHILAIEKVKVSENELKLSQENSKKSEKLKERLRENINYKKIFDYYDIAEKQDVEYNYLDGDIKNPLIIQMIARKKAIAQKNYALALNHLVNEFQLYCFFLNKNEKKDLKNYTVNQVKEDLKKFSEITISDKIIIDKVFNDRNLNQISHGVSDDKYIQNINENQYFEYEKTLKNILGKLNKKRC